MMARTPEMDDGDGDKTTTMMDDDDNGQ